MTYQIDQLGRSTLGLGKFEFDKQVIARFERFYNSSDLLEKISIRDINRNQIVHVARLVVNEFEELHFMSRSYAEAIYFGMVSDFRE